MTQSAIETEDSPLMQAPCSLPDESERLIALRSLEILDSEASPSYDRVTRLAAQALDVPIALVSLIDEHRQWFKSRVGLEATETRRDISFCGHAVANRRPLVVRDTALDPRFAANPLVTGAPFIRAYMGIPLFTVEGHAIGTLCAIDRRPRPFSDQDLATLGDYAAIIQELLSFAEFSLKAEKTLEFAEERDALFRDTFECAPFGIVHTDLTGRTLRSNARVCELLGLSADDFRELTLRELIHPDDAIRAADLERSLSDGTTDRYQVEERLLERNGEYRLVLRSVFLIRTAIRESDYLIQFVEDLETSHDRHAGAERDDTSALRRQISRMLGSTAESRRAQERLNAITDSIPARIGYWNRGLICEFANQAYQDWYGLPAEKIVGTSLRDLLGEHEFQEIESHVSRALAGTRQRFEQNRTRADGTVAVAEVRLIPDSDESGTVRGYYLLATDITALRTAQRALEAVNGQLHHDSITDYLTRLFNRRYFGGKCDEAALRVRAGGPGYGLILIDVDDFKRINDEYGHDVGDEVLRGLGRVLRAQLRQGADLSARLGGEEFAILCLNDPSDAVLRGIAERLRDQMRSNPVHSSKGSIRVTCSFGVSRSRPDDPDSASVYKRADAALYRAKSRGKDCVEGSDPVAV